MRNLPRFGVAMLALLASISLQLPASASREPIDNRAREAWHELGQDIEAGAAYATAVAYSQGAMACPLPGAEVTDSWGAARSGGRGHTGVDLLMPEGTPVLAPASGYVEHRSVSLGGRSFFLTDVLGREWFGTHLSAYGTAGDVQAGEVIGYVGDDGNAAGTMHLHLGLTVGGDAVNPYPYVRDACAHPLAPVSTREQPSAPTFRYGVMEIHRWANVTFGRIDGRTARTLTRYLNTVVGNRLASYLDAISIPYEANWDRVAACESGGNWAINTGNGYFGGVQFSLATWQSVGGQGLPSDNSKAEQIRRAEILRLRSGLGQWPVCGPRWYG